MNGKVACGNTLDEVAMAVPTSGPVASYFVDQNTGGLTPLNQLTNASAPGSMLAIPKQ
jgi:hypothetical protein